ncbi:MAG: DUF1573 domain-containing protein [Verrucomicrobiales bacterium]
MKLALTASFALAAAAGIAAVFIARDTSPVAASAQDPAAAAAAPRPAGPERAAAPEAARLPLPTDLKFESSDQSKSAKPEDEEIDVQFQFINDGDQPVVIREVESTCGCLKASADRKTYPPGEAGTIEATFKLGSFTGTQQKWVRIHTTNRVEPYRLSLSVTIPDVVVMEPDLVQWQIGEKPVPQKIKVTVVQDDPVNITDISNTRPHNMTVEKKVIKEGREYELTLTPNTTDEPMLGVVRITTDCPILKHQRKLAFFSIVKEKKQPKAEAGAGEKSE